MPKPKNPIRQRTKAGPITATADIPLRKGLSENPYTISLKIVASPEDWESIYFIGLADPEYLGTIILINLAKPVYEEKIRRITYPPPRGVHARFKEGDVIGLFMHDARKYAAAAYTIVSYWLKRQECEWSEYFKKLIKESNEKHASLKTSITNKYSSIYIVMALFEERFERRRELLGIKEIQGEIDFRNTYMKKEYLIAAKSLFEKINRESSIDELYEIMT